MHDLRKYTAAVSRTYLKPPSNRAAQCFPQLPDGRSFVAQGHTSGSIEDADISLYSAPDSRGNCTRLGWMRLIDADHPTAVAGMVLNGRLGVVVSWRDQLGFVPWQDTKGRGLTKAQSGFRPMFGGARYAYIDHGQRTICLRYGGRTYRLFEFNTDTGAVGKQIGKAVTPPHPAVGQGYFTGKCGGDFLLFTMWGYGKPSQKQWCVVRRFTDGAGYSMNARVLPGYSTLEPEGGWVGYDSNGDGVVHFGFSSIKAGTKLPINVRVTPGATPTQPAQQIDPSKPSGTWVVLPSAAPFLWGIKHKAGDKTDERVQQREPGFQITTGKRFVNATDAQGKAREWLLTGAGYRYAVDYLRKVKN